MTTVLAEQPITIFANHNMLEDKYYPSIVPNAPFSNASVSELLTYTRQQKLTEGLTKLLRGSKDAPPLRISPSTRVINKKGKAVVNTTRSNNFRTLGAFCPPSIQDPDMSSFWSSLSSSSSLTSSDITSSFSSSSKSSEEQDNCVVLAKDLWKVWVTCSASVVVTPSYIVDYMPKSHLSPAMRKRYEMNPKYAVKLNYGDRNCIGMMPFGGHSLDEQQIELDKFARMLHVEWLQQGRPMEDNNGICTEFYDRK